VGLPAVICGGAGLAMLVVGTVLACLAAPRPARAEALEVVAGLLIVAGLALIGIAVDSSFPPGFFVR
jgi:hypothetical protein